jgi:glycosyltransferase involved in cell wall biosynthesis
LEAALCRLGKDPEFSDLSLLVFGSSDPSEPFEVGIPVKYVGRIHDDASLAILYSAADITVTPSTQEAFGMTASESMACGTPVVAFATTGPLDVIDHLENGYLAAPFDVNDLAAGIAWALDKSRFTRIADAARTKCQRDFDISNVATRYLTLYKSLQRKNN